MCRRIIALCGNPNTGKSTVFNLLTGLKQHTGNWSGKTVGTARGTFKDFEIVDLPGMYSLKAKSPDEEKAVEFLQNGGAELAVIITDGTCIERNLILALQISDITEKTVICVNMMDETAKKGITVDIEGLSRELGVKVIPMAAGRREGLGELEETLCGGIEKRSITGLRETEYYLRRSKELYERYVTAEKEADEYFDRKIARIVLNDKLGIPVILPVFTLMLWITVVGANYPSAALSRLFDFSGNRLLELLTYFQVNERMTDLCVNGVFILWGK
ncbi:MAG: 50S ribosome-binding GTPase [Clostridiales bacterium]|nr:50S ribosome-binding GTPase [Clostridiales bacterium]